MCNKPSSCLRKNGIYRARAIEIGIHNTDWFKMHCCGDHVVSVPRPDDFILSVCCSDNMTVVDAQAGIWSKIELKSQTVVYSTCNGAFFSITGRASIDSSTYSDTDAYWRPVESAKGNLRRNHVRLSSDLHNSFSVLTFC
jgi:hypothetical protein